ncbi:MAG: hypothetical protein KGO48_05195 [Alphaproteobacteria bacterium]|nr:hypothetical protein [Alphaproteobacteria bacterium]
MRHMNKFVSTGAMSAVAITLVTIAALAQGNAGDKEPPVLANKIDLPSGGSSRLLVTTNSFEPGGALSDKYTQNGDNMSPGLFNAMKGNVLASGEIVASYTGK